MTYNFVFHSNEMACRKRGPLGLDPIKSVVKFIIGKVETSIDFKLGVKQGQIMALVLFMFLMMALAETPED